MKITQRTLRTDLPIEQSNWYRESPQRASFKGHAYFPVVVIGAGIAGLSAAYHLAKVYGTDVRVLEAREVGSGGSGKSAGIITIDVAEMETYKALDKMGPEKFAEIAGYLKRAVSGMRRTIDEEQIDCDMRNAGSLCLFYDTSNAGKEIRALESMGFNAHMIPGQELGRYVIGSQYSAAIHYPEDFSIDPYAFANGLAEAAERTGRVEIFENTPVESIDIASRTVQVPCGTVKADNILIGANPYAFDMGGLPRRIRRRVIPIDMFTSVIGGEIPFTGDYNFWEEDTPGSGDYLFGRALGGSRMLLCAEGYEVWHSGKASASLEDYGEANILSAQEHFHGRKFIHKKTYGGRIGLTEDDVMRMGRVSDGVTMLSIGHGIPQAYLSGQLAASAVLHSDEKLPAHHDINKRSLGQEAKHAVLRVAPERSIGHLLHLYEKFTRQ